MKLGKKPARQDAIKFKLKQYMPALPTPPKKYGHYALEGSDWGMLGNDRYGDCVWAGAAHETMLWNREASKTVLFNDLAVLSDYSAATGFTPNDPSTDQGTDMQAAASYRQHVGIRDAQDMRHKIGAYLAITPGDKDQVKQAMYLFGNVGIGFEFPSYAMKQFNDGKSWHLQSRGTIEGGHYVPAVGYDGRYLYVISWGRVQKMSWGFFKKYCDEAIVYLSEEFLTGGKSPEGFELAALQADLASLR